MTTDATLSVFVDESGRFQFPDRESPMTESEYKFFGGVRNFKRNYLRFVKAKEM
jgi:hypothetical protein